MRPDAAPPPPDAGPALPPAAPAPPPAPGGLLAALPPLAGGAGEARDTVAHRVRRTAPRPAAAGRPAAEVDPALAKRLRARRAEAEQRGGGAVFFPPGTRPDAESAVALTEHGLEVRLEDGLLQVRLPFRVSIARLTRHLRSEGYHMAYPRGEAEDEAYEPDPPDIQAWGPDFEAEGYYPYSVFADPAAPEERSVFAFPPRPEDVVEQQIDGRVIQLPCPGAESHGLVDRWLPILAAAAEQRGRLH